MQLRDIAQVVPDRRDWPRIAYCLGPVENLFALRFLSLCHERKWLPVNLAAYGRYLPVHLVPQGAIVSGRPDDPLIRELLRLGCPIVRITGYPGDRGSRQIPVVVLGGLEAEGRVAAEHFHERGFHHVGYVGNKPWGDAKALYDAFKARAAELGMRCHLLRLGVGAQGHQANERWRQAAFTKWIRAVPKPLGLLAHGDCQGIKLIGWCVDAGVVVPRDVAVLGRGNVEANCENAVVRLSSVAVDYAGAGEATVRLLEKMIKGDPVPDQETTVVIPPLGVATRESTDVLASRDPVVAQALEFMWRNLARDLGVGDIACEVGVSRRVLERAFRLDLNRGVNQELQRRRIEVGRELLLTTLDPVSDLARALGFNSVNYFVRAFHKAVGVSPARYRQQAVKR